MSTRPLTITDLSSDSVGLRIVLPAAQLAPFVSAYYRTEVAQGTVIEDWLPPEAANLRTGLAEVYEAAIGDAPMVPVPVAILSGPTNRATHLRIGSGKFWGIGLTPAGWARLVALPANEFANRFADIDDHSSLAALAGLLHGLRHRLDDSEGAVALIEETLLALLGERPRHESTVHAVHLATVAEGSTSVGQLASMAGMNIRTFERFCNRHFGFPPQALLRRQRFLRSLSKFLLDPSMRWVDSLDSQYCDQAHFIRDFRAMMGMTPGRYADLPHPIAGAAAQARSAAAGEAMQALYRPRRPEGNQTGL